jgi:hypothetical protein
METVEQIAIDYIIDQYRSLRMDKKVFPDTQKELEHLLESYQTVLRDIMKPIEYKALMLQINMDEVNRTRRKLNFVIGL